MIAKELNIAIEKKLREYVDDDNEITKAMKYSLLNGGKRIRPTLVLEFCKLCGAETKNVLPYACAVEMIHTYSLIHDDLPCMDDDKIRRGKDACHVKFGEAIALLAGDGLLNKAFEVMLDMENLKKVGIERGVTAASTLAKACGTQGMILGQAVELQHEGKIIDKDILEEIYINKTGKLIIASCVMGCILAGANKKQIEAAFNYGKAIGLAFQIVDDLLDNQTKSDIIGKPTGSDIKNNKKTYVLIYGYEKSKQKINSLTQEAINSIKIFDNATFLEELALNLQERNK